MAKASRDPDQQLTIGAFEMETSFCRLSEARSVSDLLAFVVRERTRRDGPISQPIFFTHAHESLSSLQKQLRQPYAHLAFVHIWIVTPSAELHAIT
jgi:hypothetical protein